MEVTIDKELQDAVAKIYRQAFNKGYETGVQARDIVESEPENSNVLDPATLNTDERAIWEHGFDQGFDDAVAILEVPETVTVSNRTVWVDEPAGSAEDRARAEADAKADFEADMADEADEADEDDDEEDDDMNCGHSDEHYTYTNGYAEGYADGSKFNGLKIAAAEHKAYEQGKLDGYRASSTSF